MHNVTSGRMLRKIGWASAGLTLAVGVASTGMAGAVESTNTITATFSSSSVEVTSSKYDLSNVVLKFCDGSTQRFEGLRGRTGTFAGTGDFSGDALDGAWIKAGNNNSDDGPGYGEWKDGASDACGSSTPATTSTGPRDIDSNDIDSNDNTDGGGLAPGGGGGGGGGGAAPDATPAAAGNGDTAVVGAEFDCDSVTATSSKDLSNLVVVLTDGTTTREVKLDGLSGHSYTYDPPAGWTVVAVYVKSGANHSGDGPGYGERIDSDATCALTTPGGSPLTPGGNTLTPGGNTLTPGGNTPAAAVLASVDVPEAAALGAAVAGERVAAAPSGADVLGVTLERGPAVSARTAGAAPATLATTGIDITGLLLASGGLLSSGAVLVRRTRRK